MNYLNHVLCTAIFQFVIHSCITVVTMNNEERVYVTQVVVVVVVVV